MAKSYTIGLDYGTNSVRAVLVDVADGNELATSVWDYRRGDAGVIIDEKNPNLARQHPQDYIDGTEAAIRNVLEQGKKQGVSAEEVIGLGVDTTGSTPLPLREDGTPLAFVDGFTENPNAMAWLWKDHTSVAEAEEITEQGRKHRPEYLGKYGGIYSSEWYWAKILHCVRVDRAVFDAAYTWVEIADWIPAILSGISNPDEIRRGICASGHKAMYNPQWGFPDEEFLKLLDPALLEVRNTLPSKIYDVRDVAGYLSKEWAESTGLSAGIPVAVGAFDAHLGGVGSGIKPGTLVKIIGTSTCDMMVAPEDQDLPDIPGLAGIVPGSILPGHFGLEAGQSAVGDIFNWYVQYMQPGGERKGSHEALTAEAEKLRPGESGLLALDWSNGNRSVLVDQRLTGSLFGLSLHTTPAEMYRAFVEATAFGARVIMERFEEYGQKVEDIINCGGISVKNPMVMQIYADVMNRRLSISRSTQTPALGSAIAGAVVAGSDKGGYPDYETAMDRMTGLLDTYFEPKPENVAIYERLYQLYKRLHDTFGVKGHSEDLYDIKKELIRIRDEVRL